MGSDAVSPNIIKSYFLYGDDPAGFVAARSFLDLCRSECLRQIAEARRAIDARAPERLRFASHRLAGTTMGASAMEDAARRLNSSAHEGDFDRALDLLIEVESECQRALQFLEDWLADRDPEAAH